MAQPDMTEHTVTPAVDTSEERSDVAGAAAPVGQTLIPQTCPACGGAVASAPTSRASLLRNPQARPWDGPAIVPPGRASPSSHVYAIGKIEPRFPHLGSEKELHQVIGREDTKGQPDRQAMHSVLSKAENRYLARQLCWVMTIEGMDTYILIPRDPADITVLVDALRTSSAPADLDVVIGVKGPIALPDMCNGLQVPIVMFDQIYSFTRETLIHALKPPPTMKAEDFRAASEELFDRLMQMADNAGDRDEHRAVNYLAVRYQAIYAHAAEAFGHNASLSAVDVRPSRLSGTRNVVDVIFSYTHRNTDVTEKSFVRVDVTEEWPFLVTKLAPYYDR
jgi:hypothetical protein